MKDDNFAIFILLVILFITWMCLIIAVCMQPTKVKNTNCIYHNEQIYCLQESEGEEND